MEEQNRGFFSRLKAGLSKTRNQIVSGLDAVFTASEIDEDFYEELEEILIMGDVGVHATQEIISKLRDHVDDAHLKKPEECRDHLTQLFLEQMQPDEHAYDFENVRSIVLVVGVNGAGKTTSVGKLALQYKQQGKHVIVAAADTFRAGAVEQLHVWADRAGVEIIKGTQGQDPSSVLYDALQAFRSRKADILLCDTAGRLHNKKNLMEELKKMNRVIDRECPDVCRETLVVLDGATGQNALNQARDFNEATPVDGVILTKLDGSAKGGIAIAIESELHIPVKYIGVGEKAEDLQKFDAKRFVEALLTKNEDGSEEGEQHVDA
ncbi:MAG: signal recognition particle-docking protein FtsY [Lachnospiraceae bacterium]|nr:signal recognition particle-docking protein FtsY [Lachnospiraceae bacterium]